MMQAQSKVYPVKSSISSRTQSGKNFDYMSGEVVIDHMNEVFGFNGWSQSFFNMETKMLCNPDTHPKGKPNYKVISSVSCRITLRDGTSREATGSHEAEMGDLGACMELSKKASETDALKRTCRTFGNFFGLACYKDHTKFMAPATEADRQAQIDVLLQEERLFAASYTNVGNDKQPEYVISDDTGVATTAAATAATTTAARSAARSVSIAPQQQQLQQQQQQHVPLTAATAATTSTTSTSTNTTNTTYGTANSGNIQRTNNTNVYSPKTNLSKSTGSGTVVVDNKRKSPSHLASSSSGGGSYVNPYQPVQKKVCNPYQR
jgi:recombination DNA repair RAD52 pathway protein